ncbi:uncharacterized protein LOC112086621 [Eutrema salsugineum]|uniref:uncharacterized protein LOC112086621 n=1 Tax=Eutrema salsugineum TaxID=72664 RepID=UPI000CECE80A|nr:uncharacterized protein LOC112086621 [Eutrema salsugineum]
MKVSLNDGPSWDELQEVLRGCRTWTFEKRRMVGCLCVLSAGVLGLHPASKIPLKFAKRVLDVEAFEQFPWGRVAHESLLEFIWVYETITIIGERFGNKVDGIEVPLLSWLGSRKRYDFDLLMEEDKTTHERVRVRHIIVNDGEDLKPKWSNDNVDSKVDKLLDDILHDRLDRNAWIIYPKTKTSGKELVGESDDDFVEERVNRSSKKVVKNTKHKDEMSVKESEKARKVPRVSSADTATWSTSQPDAMAEGKSGQKMALIEEKVTGKMALIEKDVAGTMESMVGKVEGKIFQLENEMNEVKELDKKASKAEEVHFSGSLNDNVNSKNPAKTGELTISSMGSWMVLQKQTSDGVTTQCVVRTAKPFVKENVFPPYQPTDELIDITEEVAKADATMRRPSHSGSMFSNSFERKKCNNVDIALDAIAGALGVDTPLIKQKKQKAASQLFPFLGKSAVNRLKDGHMTSFAHLLRKRSLRDPTPLYSPRIAFLDQCWVNSWYHDYKQFAINPKNFMFRESYVEVLNGAYPYYAVTNKKWVVDVDHLYFAHNINDRHWIALQVNLLRRKSNVPQNIQTGDCGVYTCKFIECHALGYSFDGISDKSMPFLRMKIEVELFDEVPDTYNQMFNPLHRGNQSERLLLHNDSQP